jgi:malate permease and related proteins
MILTLFAQVCLPIFVVVGLGWLLDRKFSLSLETLVKLNLYALVPAFIFVRVLDTPLTGSKAGWITLATFCTVLLCAVVSQLVCSLLKLDLAARKAHVLSCMLANCGNFGLPLMALAFGREAAAVQVYVLVAMNLSTFTLGTFLANSGGGPGGTARALKATLRQPAVYAVTAALITKALGLPVQELRWLWEPAEMLAEALVGFALLTLGVQLSQTKPAPLEAPLVSALVVRLLVGPVLAFGVTQLMHFDAATAAVIILAMGAPTAVNSALLTFEYGGDKRFATGSVYYSTLVSMVTVTLWLAALRAWMMGSY